jgi:hypothetical protein
MRGVGGGVGGGAVARVLWRGHAPARPGARGSAAVVLVQSAGGALVLAVNGSSAVLRLSFLLHGGEVGATNADGGGPPLYAVRPFEQRVVAAVGNVPDQDYEGAAGAGVCGFAMDHFVATLCGEAGGALVAAAAADGRRERAGGAVGIHAPLPAAELHLRGVSRGGVGGGGAAAVAAAGAVGAGARNDDDGDAARLRRQREREAAEDEAQLQRAIAASLQQ